MGMGRYRYESDRKVCLDISDFENIIKTAVLTLQWKIVHPC